MRGAYWNTVFCVCGVLFTAFGWSQGRIEWLLPTLQPDVVAVNDSGSHCAVTTGYGGIGWLNLSSGALERLYVTRGFYQHADVRGDWLAYADARTITLRRLSTDQVVYQWSLDKRINDLRFSPDGMLLAAACEDRRVRIWRVSDGALVAILPHTFIPLRVAFSHHGQWIATSDNAGYVLLWNRANGQFLGRRRQLAFLSLSFSPNDAWLASGSGEYEYRVTVFNMQSNSEAWTTNVFSWVYGVEFSADSASVFVGHSGGQIQRRASNNGALQAVMNAHTDVRALDMTPARQYLVSGSNALFVDPNQPPVRSYPAAVQVWDPNTNALLATHYGDHTTATIRPMSVAVLPDGTRVAVGDRYGAIRWYDARTGALLHTFQAHNAGIGSLAVSPNGQYLISGADDGTVRVWNTATNQLIHSVQVPNSVRMRRVAVSPDGTYFAALSYRNSVLPVWRLDTGQLVNTLSLGDGERSAAMDFDFTADSSAIVTGGLSNTVQMVDIQTGDLIQQLEFDLSDIHLTRVSPNGRWLLVSGSNNAFLWDLVESRIVNQFDGFVASDAAFLPSLQAVVTLGDQGIWFWRYSTTSGNSAGEPIWPLRSSAERFSLSVPANERYLYLAHEGEGIAAWRLPNPADIDRNGCVDDADLLTVLFAFGQTDATPADINLDGVVDDADLLGVLFNFGDGC